MATKSTVQFSSEDVPTFGDLKMGSTVDLLIDGIGVMERMFLYAFDREDVDTDPVFSFAAPDLTRHHFPWGDIAGVKQSADQRPCEATIDALRKVR